ncbi:MAG: outer membrane lipoprotein carrier protein LolA [Alphaproteobacteria bacterium]|nr:outer membrane lipoprotein carrier protein LolA [Alphaproteobacteria bacterium]
MKLFKITFLLFYSVIICNYQLFSQNSDPKAVMLLNNFSENFKKSSGTKIQASLKSFSIKNQLIAEKNFDFYAKGNLYFLKEKAAEIICDGKFIYNYDGVSSITKVSVEDSDPSLNPQSIFSGNYKGDFIIKFKTPNASPLDIIILTPIDTRKNISTIEFSLNKTTHLLTQVKIIDKAKNYNILYIKSFKFNIPIDKNYFIFNKNKYPKETELFD